MWMVCALGYWVPTGIAPGVQKLCPVSREITFSVMWTKFGTNILSSPRVCHYLLWMVCALGCLGVIAPGVENCVRSLKKSLFWLHESNLAHVVFMVQGCVTTHLRVIALWVQMSFSGYRYDPLWMVCALGYLLPWGHCPCGPKVVSGLVWSHFLCYVN